LFLTEYKIVETIQVHGIALRASLKGGQGFLEGGIHRLFGGMRDEAVNVTDNLLGQHRYDRTGEEGLDHF
jgi:hypothetical protein